MKNIFIYLILTLFLVVTIEYISGRDFLRFSPKNNFSNLSLENNWEPTALPCIIRYQRIDKEGLPNFIPKSTPARFTRI